MHGPTQRHPTARPQPAQTQGEGRPLLSAGSTGGRCRAAGYALLGFAAERQTCLCKKKKRKKKAVCRG